MIATRQKQLALCLATVLGSIVGCGDPNKATVQGTVTLDGNVVPTGSILFIPSQGGAQAYATIDQFGDYSVFTGREEGLRPGEYKVTVVSREKPATGKTELGGPAPVGRSITPRWYASTESSGLTFAIVPGSNDIDLKLTSQPPPGWSDLVRHRR